MSMLNVLVSDIELRRKLYFSLVGFGLLALIVDSYILGINYYSVSGYGDWGVVSQELVGWLCLLGLLLMAVALAGMLLDKLRRAAFAMLLGAGLFVVLTLSALWVSDQVRYQGFERLASEATPLVEAIKSFEQAYGRPPEDLSDIKVAFPEGHDIRGGTLPQFTYLSGYRAKERYHGNPWVLLLQTPTGPLRWDQFVYYPLQNYPPLGHGGWFEPIQEWAYVHE